MTPSLSLRVTSARHGMAPILGAISLDLFPGETAVLTGPSGIGKTTLLRIVAGLHRDWQGQITRPGSLAMVFQEPTLLPWRTVLDNITLPTACTPKAAHALLEDVGLAPLHNRYPRSLSLGQQRRLALARAFALRPDVLLMDEPFVSLDPGLVAEMMALFARLRGKSPVATLMVTHSEDEATALASRILRLSGQPATLTADAPNPAQNSGAYFQLSASGVTSSRS